MNLKRIIDISRKCAFGLLLGVAVASLCTQTADGARRRTIKSSTSTEARTPASTETASPETTKTSRQQSRSEQRRASLPDESLQTSENKSVSNNSGSDKNSAKTAKQAQETKTASKNSGKQKVTKEEGKSVLQTIKVEKPNLEAIKEATLDPKSNYYFPKLWDKYMAKVPVMTPEEFRYLYLGYMFQEDYDPYRTSPYTEYTDNMRDRSSYTRAELEDIINTIEKALKDNPFDLRQMSFLVHMLKEHDKNNKAKIWEFRLENLLGAIKSTGTGADVENAWYVIYPMHEYDMVQLLGYRAVDVDYVDSGFDHLLVEPDGSVKINKPVSGFYFNVEVPQRQYIEKHPEDQDEVAADE